LAIGQKRMTVSSYRTRLLPTVTSKVYGTISLRQTILPWKSSAAMTDDPNAQKTSLPSVVGVGAA